ncbi:NAD(P)/FAD-dependent oxidoreductase [Novispirillum itersonii]|uniref:Glycine/D-amino acid oxidase-like deaminating enzyme n=1 Tax=Novispirillum itersonii TaxID=189 RepID=A0A7X0DMI6_NOVIT|nr:FAD-binding oxidoreductase [Novispirillum itersonii]MBB6211096.1 glycine/D-amino acid oxidase-like deaminating enzyme [Novispirillum itersonii]
MRRIRRLPSDDSCNGWNALLPPRAPRPALRGDITADWVVVGAGYTGLAAARRLAELRPQDHVVVLEAQTVADGSSGRNSGFAIDLPHNITSSVEELAQSHAYRRLARASIAHLRDLTTRHGIACDWSDSGKYHAAASPHGVRGVLEPTRQELERLEEPYEWLEGPALAARLGTASFAAALYTPGTVLLNPAALVRGLADSLPASVTLYEGSPVTGADLGSPVTLTTPHGTVRAARMILAVNGLAPQFGFFRNRLLPFSTYGSLTRPLTEAEYDALGRPAPWGLTPAHAFAGATLRLTNDRRLLVRQTVEYSPAFQRNAGHRARVAARHRALLARRFPMLPEITFDTTWSGMICVSQNGAPGFGAVAPHITAAVCHNGAGVTKGTIGGLLAADLACGQDNPLIGDLLSLGQPQAIPPRPALDIGVRARFAWELWTARHEA